MYHQQPRGRGRARGFRGASRGQGVSSPIRSGQGYLIQGRGSFGVLGGRVTVPPYQVQLPAAPHPFNTAWLDRVTEAWEDSLNGSRAVTDLPSVLWDAFGTTSQPYLRLLDLVIFNRDYSKNRPDGLTAAVLHEFRNWLEEHYGSARNVPPSMLNDKARQLAFQAIGGQECSYISDLIVELCDLTGSALMFVDEMNTILQAKDYKKACQLATRLHLHDQFGVDEFVTPLVLLDRANVAELYLADAPPTLQAAAVTALDDLLDRSPQVAASNLGMPSFAKDSVNQKTLKKLIERWCKKFGLDVRKAAPKTALFAARATLNYLFYRRFRERSIKPDDCEDFLLDILAENPELYTEAFERLRCEGALKTLLNVALTLQVSYKDLPYEHMDLYFRQPEVDDDQIGVPPSPRSRGDFYQLPRHVTMELVERPDQLPSVIRGLQLYAGPLGLDAEWKPISVREVNTVSLLQVATTETVYVFDLLELEEAPRQLMEQLGSAVLCGTNLKLGFDLVSDFDMLEASVPSFSKAIKNKKNIMDVRTLGQRVEAAFPDTFPFKEAPAAADDVSAGGGRRKPNEVAKGLSELVRKCTGRPLDKDEQCSNWNRRPLRPTQLEYAATDAYCLVAVYEVLREKLMARQRTTPQEVMRCIVTSAGAGDAAGAASKTAGAGGKAAGKPKQKKAPSVPRGQEVLQNAPAPNSRAIRPDAFRAVCDTMVQGLGKKLRSIGADAVILENGEDHDQCVALCRREGRVILTRGRQLHRRMAGMVGPGLCYRVDAEKAADQLEEVVRHFRIDVAPDDVFKRCQYCNCADYWRVPSGVMRRLRDRLVSYSSPGRNRSDYCPLEAQGPAQIDLSSGLVRYTTVYVDAASLHTSTLDSTDTFYVCQGCGHVYWAGSHHGKYMANLGNIVGGAYGGACGGQPTQQRRTSGRPPPMLCESDSEDDWPY